MAVFVQGHITYSMRHLNILSFCSSILLTGAIIYVFLYRAGLVAADGRPVVNEEKHLREALGKKWTNFRNTDTSVYCIIAHTHTHTH